jgi:cell filamentation protein
MNLTGLWWQQMMMQGENCILRVTAVINADSSMLADIIKIAVSPIPTQTVDDNTRSNTDMSKQRVLVMNGQRVLQSEEAGKWKNDNVDKAGRIKSAFTRFICPRGRIKPALIMGRFYTQINNQYISR